MAAQHWTVIDRERKKALRRGARVGRGLMTT